MACWCASISPGISVRPPTSMTRAPSGGCVAGRRRSPRCARPRRAPRRPRAREPRCRRTAARSRTTWARRRRGVVEQAREAMGHPAHGIGGGCGEVPPLRRAVSTRRRRPRDGAHDVLGRGVLAHVAGRPGIDRELHDLGVVVGREDHDVRGGEVGAHRARDLGAREAGHVQVDERHVGRERAHEVDHPLAARRDATSSCPLA